MNLENDEFINDYRKYSMVIGKEVNVLRMNESILAHVLDIDECGALIVQYEDGTKESLNTGEISIRLKKW